jgi:vitamin B12 transporter
MPRSLRLLLVLLACGARALHAQFPPEIHGRVTERGSGAPIPGAVIEVAGSGLRTVAAADGGFHLRGLLPGEREIRVRAFGYRTRAQFVQAENGRSLWLLVALEPEAMALEGIRVTAERGEAGATTLDRAEIEASGARELGELLRDQAGVVVTRRGGPGAPAHVSIRGSSADEVLVLLDGVPVNSLLTGEADLSIIPLEAVGRVTVLRGAQSARYGGRAMAGVILVETRRSAAPELGARLRAGSWGELGGAFSAGTRAHVGRTELDGLATAEWQQVAGDFPYAVPAVGGGGESVRRNADVAGWNALAAGSVRHGETEVRARVEALGLERGMPGSIVQSAETARQAQDRLSGSLSAAGRRGVAEWIATLDAGRQRAAYHDHAPPFGAPYDDEVKVGSAGASFSATALLGANVLAAGAELRRMGFASTMLAEGAPDGQALIGAWTQGRLSRDLTGMHLEILPGLRVDYNALLDRAFLSPRLGASGGTSRWTARISVGSAYSPPSLADQFFQEGVMVRPNPDLRPERVRMEVEGGLELRDLPLGPARLDAEFAAYRADVDGMILWSPDHRFVWSPDNFDVRRSGWDAGLRALLPSLGAELRASASRAAVEYDTPTLSGQVMYRPRWTASGGVAATLLGVRAEMSARYVGERRTVENPRLNRLPPHTLFDARLTRRWSTGVWGGEMSLSAENLLDRDAAMLLDYPYPRRSWGLSARLRREPRRVSAPANHSPHAP